MFHSFCINLDYYIWTDKIEHDSVLLKTEVLRMDGCICFNNWLFVIKWDYNTKTNIQETKYDPYIQSNFKSKSTGFAHYSAYIHLFF